MIVFKHAIMKSLLLQFLFIIISLNVYSWNKTAIETEDRNIKIFLDCDDCNSSFFIRHLTFVDLVRDAKLADVHIFVTKQKTASNGVEYIMDFIGMNQYSDLQYKLKTISPQNETDILKWKRLLKIINIGLLPYLSRTPDIDKVHIKHDFVSSPLKKETCNPWNYWIYHVELGSEFEGEESEKDYSLNSAFKAYRITDVLKFKSKLSYDLDKETYKDDDEIIKSKKEEAEFNARLIYSLNPRWSAGVFCKVSTSSYMNYNLASYIGLAIEYNIFPWDKSDNKVFTIAYHFRSNYFNYEQLTIFDKMEEFKTSESLEISLLLRQPWGEIENTLECSHYMNDFSKNRLSLESDISINVSKGLSFFTELDAELVHDQLYLPAGENTREEILLQQTKLATNFEISGEIGIRFTFGSTNNNIVNQRL